MSNPLNVTDSASGFSRLPSQTGQIAAVRNCATRRFIEALFVFANVSRMYRRAPTNVPE